jgi:ATP-binding cassette subfamily C protein LapB
LVFLPLALFAGLAFWGPLKRLSASQVQESNLKNGLLVEAIDGMETIKATAAAPGFVQRWTRVVQDLADKELQLKLLTNLATQLTQTVQQLSYVTVVIVGAMVVMRGDLTMGGLIACAILSSRAIQPFAQLPALLAQHQTARVSLQALDGIMALPDDREADLQLITPASCKGRLRFEEVSFRYGRDPVVDLPHLEVPAGQRLALLGPVGGGKSTLLRLLAGLYRPSSGQIYLDDIDLFQIAPTFVRRQLAYLPQDVRLFQGSLRDNLKLGLAEIDDIRLLDVCEHLGMGHWLRSHPRGLDLPIQEGGRGVSGGQRQLIGLARALMAEPKVLLLDEPSASMDAGLEAQVIEGVRRLLPAEASLVVASHRAAWLTLSSRVVFLVGGRVAMEGPTEQVMKSLSGFMGTSR